jgi:hypothetical protein
VASIPVVGNSDKGFQMRVTRADKDQMFAH